MSPTHAMGPAGAAAVALFAAFVGGLGAILVALAWRGTRGAPRTGPARWTRALVPVGLALLVLGVVLPKSALRALEFETSGRIAMLIAAVVGGGAALAAWRRREPGAVRALLVHVYFGALAASPLGEWVFGVFRML